MGRPGLYSGWGTNVLGLRHNSVESDYFVQYLEI